MWINPRPEQPSLDDWVQRISVEEMPVMYRTALDIATFAANEETPSALLVNAILKDPGLTARVLNLGNSVFHNPGNSSLSTVSRALVVLGSNTIRSICLSVTLVDSLLQGSAREQLYRELARSFHSAVLARTMAIELRDESSEEVFIAALLYRLGDMAFWSFGGGLRDALENEVRRERTNPQEAERNILNFRLRDLSLGLAKKWQLGLLLESSLEDRNPGTNREKCVRLSAAYVETLGIHGDADETKRLETAIGSLLSLAPQPTAKMLEACVREAAETARACGAGTAANKIARLLVKESVVGTAAPVVSKAFPEEPIFPKYDPLLQLKILREFTTLISTTVDFNEVMETILEGMYRSVGMDRALFALVMPDRKHLVAKLALGHDVTELKEQFDIPLGEHEQHIFQTALDKRTILWAQVGSPAGSLAFVQKKIRQLVGAGPFFVAPAVMCGKSIGLFYADRRISERPLDEDSFQAFKHFAQQANLGLDFMSRQKQSKD